ncbi:hypothetical protein [Maricaulis sp.]|uniref:hypothetical protein n=1 Tax=Maricaulis sp. TaxID=1486257 RepID=UPI003A953E81
MTATHDQIVTALQGVLATAFADLDPEPEFRVRDPRLIDVAKDAGTDLRALVMLIPGAVSQVGFLNGDPPIWDLSAAFDLGIDAVGPDDAVREARVSAIRTAASAAITANYRLGGVASYAEVRRWTPETGQDEGMPAETMHELQIEVLFQSLTPTG